MKHKLLLSLMMIEKIDSSDISLVCDYWNKQIYLINFQNSSVLNFIFKQENEAFNLFHEFFFKFQKVDWWQTKIFRPINFSSSQLIELLHSILFSFSFWRASCEKKYSSWVAKVSFAMSLIYQLRRFWVSIAKISIPELHFLSWSSIVGLVEPI